MHTIFSQPCRLAQIWHHIVECRHFRRAIRRCTWFLEMVCTETHCKDDRNSRQTAFLTNWSSSQQEAVYVTNSRDGDLLRWSHHHLWCTLKPTDRNPKQNSLQAQFLQRDNGASSSSSSRKRNILSSNRKLTRPPYSSPVSTSFGSTSKTWRKTPQCNHWQLQSPSRKYARFTLLLDECVKNIFQPLSHLRMTRNKEITSCGLLDCINLQASSVNRSY